MSTEQPTPAAQPSPGRDAKGRFTTGNTGGPGNPFGRRLAAMRQAVMNAVSADDIEALLKKLLEMAMGGDLAAAKLVLQYAVGKPKPVAEPDRTEIEASEIETEKWVTGEEFSKIVSHIPSICFSTLSDAMTDIRAKQLLRAALYGEGLTEPVSKEEEEQMKREFEEANTRFEFEQAAKRHVDEFVRRQAAAGPSSAGRNGGNGKHRKSNGNGRPSSAGRNRAPLSPCGRGVGGEGLAPR